VAAHIPGMATNNEPRKRNKDTGAPGNGGKFAPDAKAESSVSLGASERNTTVENEAVAWVMNRLPSYGILGENDPWRTDPDRISRIALLTFVKAGDPEVGALIQSAGPQFALDHFSALRRPDLESIGYDTAEVVKRTRRGGYDVVTPEDAGWPAQLDDLGDTAPYALWTDGDKSLLGDADDLVAIGGNRDQEAYGSHMAMELGAALVAENKTLVAGAAGGISGVVHTVALASKSRSVSVISGGFSDMAGQAENALMSKIRADGGLIVSEHPPRTAPARDGNPELRARLTAALAGVTVVADGNEVAAVLGQARAAKALGRPVYAFPGAVTARESAGANELIAEGTAQLAVSVDDLLKRIL
jgi:DNA processing protein